MGIFSSNFENTNLSLLSSTLTVGGREIHQRKLIRWVMSQYRIPIFTLSVRFLSSFLLRSFILLRWIEFSFADTLHASVRIGLLIDGTMQFFYEKQYVKLTLRLGWSFGKNTFVLKGIWQRLHLGRRPKPVSRALKLPHSFEQSFGETFRLTVRLYHHTVLFLFLQNSALWHLFVKVFRWKWKRNCWKKRGKLIYFCF